MSVFEKRIASLEQITRERRGILHVPGLLDSDISEIRRVAATCDSPEELAAYLRSRLPNEAEKVVSLDERRRNDAVLAAAARTIFEEVRLPGIG